MLAPDVNSGEYRFEPVDAKTIRYGLGAVKGTGESAIAAILQARKDGGAFRDLFDFCTRVDKRAVNQARGRGAGARRRFRFPRRRRGCAPREPARLGRRGARGGGQAERNAMQTSPLRR